MFTVVNSADHHTANVHNEAVEQCMIATMMIVEVLAISFSWLIDTCVLR
jgi:hypothetical protein